MPGGGRVSIGLVPWHVSNLSNSAAEPYGATSQGRAKMAAVSYFHGSFYAYTFMVLIVITVHFLLQPRWPRILLLLLSLLLLLLLLLLVVVVAVVTRRSIRHGGGGGGGGSSGRTWLWSSL